MSAWREMADETAAMELLEAHDRIRDLERELDVAVDRIRDLEAVREMSQMLLGGLHGMTLRYRRERRRRIRAERGTTR